MRNASDRKRNQHYHQRSQKRFFILSGMDEGNIFYTKTILKNGTLTTFELRYSEENAAIYSPPIKPILKCFESR